MTSVASRLVPAALRLMRANRTFLTADVARARIAERTLRPLPYGPPRRLRSDVEVSVDHRSGWPVYRLVPAAGTPRGAVVYAHGGGWVGEISPQHWRLAARIAAEAVTTVVLPIYPLVPFGTASEAVDGVGTLVRTALRDHGPTCLAGDSAGGQIALSTALALRDEGITLPRTVLISPALDLSMRNPGIDRVLPSDPWLGRHGTAVLVEHWRGGLPVDDPRVSPLAGDLAGLGPLTVFIGTRDILHPDAQLLRDRARVAGVSLDWHEQPGLVHVYPLTPTPEGAAAQKIIVASLRSAIGSD